MISTVAHASELLLNAVSSANSEALVVNAKNNSTTNDFKSALNQAKQEAPQGSKKLNDAKDSNASSKSEVAKPETDVAKTTSQNAPSEEISKTDDPKLVSSLDAALAMPYVTTPPLPTLSVDLSSAELDTEAETTSTPLLEVLKKPETHLELTTVDELDPTLVQKALEAVKEKTTEASSLLNLDASKVVQEAPLILNANALEASLKAGDISKTIQDPAETSLEASPLTDSTPLDASIVRGDASSERDSSAKDEQAPNKDALVSDLPTTVQGVVPDTAFVKPLEGVVTSAQGVQGIQPLTNQVASGIQSAYDSTNKTMQIQLNPEDLGHMRIQIKQVGEGQVSARLVVERPEAVEQVKTQLQDLQRNLEQQGLKMDKIEVVLAGANSQASSDSNKDQNKDNAEQARFQDGLNRDGGFQQPSRQEQGQTFQDELSTLNPQGAYPIEGQDSQARLEELNALRQSYQTYKQQSISVPDVPKNQVFSTFNRTGLNVLA